MALKDLQQKIGPVQYASPRAVLVDAGTDENIAATQSAVYGSVAIHVNTQVERDRIIARWPEIIEYLAQGVQTLLDDQDDSEVLVSEPG